jgi:CheY-like chemotaxis protein
VAELRPDLVLLDVMMPGMDGFEVCRRIRADEATAEMPIILVTALDDRDSRLQGLEIGADDFISKPFDRAELRARVRTVTRLNRYRRLLAERAKFEWVVEQADEGYLLLGAQDEIIYANPQARLFLGLLSHYGGLDQTFLALARRQYQLQPAEVWRSWPHRSDAGWQPVHYLVRPETETSNAFWLQAESLAVPSGESGQRLICLRDVTAEVESRRMQSTFQSMVCHKLRTPVCLISLALEVLKEDLFDLSPSEMESTISTAVRNAERLRGATEDVLKYAEMLTIARSEEKEDRWRFAQLPSIVAETSSAFDLQSPLVTIEENLRDAQARLSRRALEMALWEILENAKKFHPRQSPIIKIQVSRFGRDQVSLQIRDDGQSLSPEQLAQIWTPYYQGEKYFTGQVPGMGVGLSVVASIVWSVGGTCQARNREDGPGVVVELALPMEK